MRGVTLGWLGWMHIRKENACGTCKISRLGTREAGVTDSHAAERRWKKLVC